MFQDYSLPIHQQRHEDQARRLRHIDRVRELDAQRTRRLRTRTNRG